MRFYKIFAVSFLSLVLTEIDVRAENAPVVDLNSIPEDSASFSADSSATVPAPEAVVSRQSLPMEERINLLERQINNLTQMNLPGKLDNLEQQINRLNGQIEEQTYLITQLKEERKQSQPVLTDTKAPEVTSPVAPPTESLQLPDQSVADTPTDVKKNNNPVINKEIEAASSSGTILAAEAAVVQNKPLAKNPPKSTTVTETGSAEKAYQAAFDLMVKKKNTAAIAAFKAFLKNYPNNANYTPSAHYWLGELYNAGNMNALASKEFNAVVQQYPTHSKVADAMFKLATIHDNAGQHAQAKRELQKVINQFPGSTAAKLAKMRLQSSTLP